MAVSVHRQAEWKTSGPFCDENRGKHLLWGIQPDIELYMHVNPHACLYVYIIYFYIFINIYIISIYIYTHPLIVLSLFFHGRDVSKHSHDAFP